MLKQLRAYPALPGQSPMPLFNTHFRDRNLSQVYFNKEVAILKPISITSSINTLLSKLCVVRAHYRAAQRQQDLQPLPHMVHIGHPSPFACISARE